MRTLLARHPLLAVLLCSFLLVLRVGEAHLHLCFDGGEAPVSIHVADVAGEHGVSVGSPHLDEDIAISIGEIVKPPVSGFELPPVLLLALLLLLAPTSGRSFAIPTIALAAVCAAFRLRPPSRGPPLTALS